MSRYPEEVSLFNIIKSAFVQPDEFGRAVTAFLYALKCDRQNLNTHNKLVKAMCGLEITMQR